MTVERVEVARNGGPAVHSGELVSHRREDAASGSLVETVRTE